MKGFKTEDSYRALYYMLENPKFVSRTLSASLGWRFGEKVSGFVNWLVDLKFVRKTNETGKGQPRYEVISRVELVKFYSRNRDMAQEVVQTYNIAADREMAIDMIGKNGGILCLTTALGLYGDEYFRDPVVHAYLHDSNLLTKMDEQVEGTTKVVLYSYVLPDEVASKNNLSVTSPNRTIIDLFCCNLAYAAERFIPKVW